MIISLYAGGMTIRDIQAHLGRTLGTELSQETIANITDAVAEEVKAWQVRPLEPVYPIFVAGRVVVKVRDNTPSANKAAHIAVGVDVDGIKHVLGIWVQTSRRGEVWAGVLAELRNRGVQDVLIACCDGLTGFPEAIEATWPNTVVQTCVVRRDGPARHLGPWLGHELLSQLLLVHMFLRCHVLRRGCRGATRLSKPGNFHRCFPLSEWRGRLSPTWGDVQSHGGVAAWCQVKSRILRMPLASACVAIERVVAASRKLPSGSVRVSTLRLRARK